MKKGLLILLSVLCLLFALSSCGECQHEWVLDDETPATCEKAGSQVYVCSKCDGTKTDVLPAAHTIGAQVEAKESTCSVAGNDAYYPCTVCEKKFADAEGKNEINPARSLAAHELTLNKAVKADCTTAGTVKYYSCSVCLQNFADEAGTEKLETIVAPAKGHTMQPVAGKAATYADGGILDHFKCTVCKNLYLDDKGAQQTTVDSIKIPALTCPGHVMGDWIGSMDGITRTCTVCGVETQTLQIVEPVVTDEDGNRVAIDGISITVTSKVGQFVVNAPVAGAYNILVTGFKSDWVRATIVNTSLGDDAALWEGCTKVPAKTTRPVLTVAFGTYLKKGDNTLKITCEGDETALTAKAVLVTPGEEYEAIGVYTGGFGILNNAKATFADVKESVDAGKSIMRVNATNYNYDNWNGSGTVLVRSGWTVYYGTKMVIEESGYYILGGSMTPYCAWSDESVRQVPCVVSVTLFDGNGKSFGISGFDATEYMNAAVEAGYAGVKCGDCYTACYMELGVAYIEAGEYYVSLDVTGENGSASFITAIPAAHEHVWEEVEDCEPTCTGYGFAYVGEGEGKAKYCSYCMKPFDENTVVTAPNGHKTEGAIPVVAPATCEKDGTSTIYCLVCGAAEVTVLPKTEHNYLNLVAKEATCSEVGVKAFLCENCGDYYTEDIEKINHAWSEPVVAAASCEAAGKKVFACTECFVTKEESIPAVGHTFSAWEVKNGKLGHVCSVCEVYETVKTLSATEATVNALRPTPATSAFKFVVNAEKAGVYSFQFKSDIINTGFISLYNDAYPEVFSNDRTKADAPVDADGYSTICVEVYLDEGLNNLTLTGKDAGAKYVAVDFVVTGYRTTYLTAVDAFATGAASKGGITAQLYNVYRLCGDNVKGEGTLTVKTLTVTETGKYSVGMFGFCQNGGTVVITFADGKEIQFSLTGLSTGNVGAGKTSASGYFSDFYTVGEIELAAGEYDVVIACENTTYVRACAQPAIFLTRIPEAAEAEYDSVVHYAAVKNSCLNAGNIEYWVATKGEVVKYFTDSKLTVESTLEAVALSQLSHDYVEHDAATLTCLDDGNVLYYSCKNCDTLFTKPESDYVVTASTDIFTKAPGKHTLTYTTDTEAGKVVVACSGPCNFSADLAALNKTAAVSLANIPELDAAAAYEFKVYAADAGLYTFTFDMVASTAQYTSLTNKAYPKANTVTLIGTNNVPTVEFAAYLNAGENTMVIDSKAQVKVTGIRASYLTEVAAVAEAPAYGTTALDSGAQKYTRIVQASQDNQTLACGSLVIAEGGYYSLATFASGANGAEMTVKLTKGATVVTFTSSDLSNEADALKTAGKIRSDAWSVNVCYTTNLKSAGKSNVYLEAGTYAVTIDSNGKSGGRQLCVGNAVFAISVVHTLSQHVAVAKTCTNNGNIEYWECTDPGCGLLFTDDSCSTEITLAETVIPASHEVIKAVKTAPTTTVAGSYDLSCGKCTWTGTEEIPVVDLVVNDEGGKNLSFAPDNNGTKTLTFTVWAEDAGVYRFQFADNLARDKYVVLTNKAYPAFNSANKTETITDYAALTDNDGIKSLAWDAYLDEGLNTLTYVAVDDATLSAAKATFLTEVTSMAYGIGTVSGSAVKVNAVYRLCGDGSFTANGGWITLSDKLVIEENGVFTIAIMGYGQNGGTMDVILSKEGTDDVKLNFNLSSKSSALVTAKTTFPSGYFAYYTVAGNAILTEGEYSIKIGTTASSGGTRLKATPVIFATKAHTLTYHAAIAPGCDTTGNVAYWECTDVDCGKYFLADGTETTVADTVVAAQHDVIKALVQAPTTSVDGSYDLSCSRCTWTDTETIPAVDLVVNDEGGKNLSFAPGNNGTKTLTFTVWAEDAGVYRFQFADNLAAGKYIALTNKAYPGFNSANKTASDNGYAEATDSDGIKSLAWDAYLDEGLNTLTYVADADATLSAAKATFLTEVTSMAYGIGTVSGSAYKKFNAVYVLCGDGSFTANGGWITLSDKLVIEEDGTFTIGIMAFGQNGGTLDVILSKAGTDDVKLNFNLTSKSNTLVSAKTAQGSGYYAFYTVAGNANLTEGEYSIKIGTTVSSGITRLKATPVIFATLVDAE